MIAAVLMATTCLCGEAPERANDFFWENDRVGFRAYGPGDPHKWSGIDVFNKATTNNFVVHLLREPGKHGNWHKNVNGLGMDDYAMGPGRGVGGVALRKDGKWLPDYGDWVAYRIHTNCEERCAFELDYKLPIGGTMTLGIGLVKGCSLFVEEVKLSDDVPTEGLEVGVGLDLSAEREHTGDLFVDEKKLIVSLFEKPHNREGEEGSMMNALFAVDSLSPLSLVDGPDGSKLVMTRPLCKEDAGKPVVTVMAGADWTEAGRFKTAPEWHGYVQGLYGQFEGLGARIGAKVGEVIGKTTLGIIGGVVGGTVEAAVKAQQSDNLKTQQKGAEKMNMIAVTLAAAVNFTVQTAVHPDDFKSYDTAKIRSRFVMEKVMAPDEINLTYTMYDRFVYGGAMPVEKELTLEPFEELKAEYFLERRELGIINVGGPGEVRVTWEEPSIRDGVACVGNKVITYALHPFKFALYVGCGKKRVVTFRSIDPKNPAKFYLNSAPAYKEYATQMITTDEEAFKKNPKLVTLGVRKHLGSLKESNDRYINQLIVAPVLSKVEGGGCCQLQMGLTELEPGSVWNTMPQHTHNRRMEAYFYFNVPEGQAICHQMGRPQEQRLVWLHNEQAITAPEWSVHSAAGTSNYMFIWGMAGENLNYGDMDKVPVMEMK